MVCPVTSQVKGYPFEVRLPKGLAVGGVILADHLKSVDWKERRAAFNAAVPGQIVAEALDRLAPLLGG